MDRIAGRFARVEPRRRIGRLVLGLLSDPPRKNCWTIAEWAGEATPEGMQHLLNRAKWDADSVRDGLRDYVVEHLHDDQTVLVVDETGDVKKGSRTVGVQRQYTGTAGRIETPKSPSTWSTQVGVVMPPAPDARLTCHRGASPMFAELALQPAGSAGTGRAVRAGEPAPRQP